MGGLIVNCADLAEWFIALVLKTSGLSDKFPGFESLSQRMISMEEHNGTTSAK